jgi:hypothetical protein
MDHTADVNPFGFSTFSWTQFVPTSTANTNRDKAIDSATAIRLAELVNQGWKIVGAGRTTLAPALHDKRRRAPIAAALEFARF